MKTILTTTAFAMIIATTAFAAEPINDQRAEIFRANGCEAEWLKPVTNDAGQVLYWQNTAGKGCKADRGKTPVIEEEKEEVLQH